MIYAGGGVIAAEAADELYELAVKINSPVTLSLMGMGAFPATHELYTGMIGMHGTKASNLAVTQCDLLIAVGARFSDRVVSKLDRFAPKAKILAHRHRRGRGQQECAGGPLYCGRCQGGTRKTQPGIQPKDRSQWLDQVMALKAQKQIPGNGEELTPRYILEKIYELTGGEAIISHRSGAASDLDRPALQVYKTQVPHHLRRTGNHGVWLGRFDRGFRCFTGEKGVQYCRRRQFPHEFK